MDVADHDEPRLEALDRFGEGRDDGPLPLIAVAARRSVADHDVGVAGMSVELLGEEALAVAPRRVERPVVEPRLPGRAPDLQPAQLRARVLEVVAAQPVRDAPRLDRLVVVARDEHRLGGRDALEPLRERALEERVLGGEVALERERDVAGDQQQIALGDLRQVLVDVGGADERASSAGAGYSAEGDKVRTRPSACLTASRGRSPGRVEPA